MIDIEKRESDHRIKLMNEKHNKEIELLQLKIDAYKSNLKKNIFP